MWGLTLHCLYLPTHFCHFISSVDLNRKCLEQGFLAPWRPMVACSSKFVCKTYDYMGIFMRSKSRAHEIFKRAMTPPLKLSICLLEVTNENKLAICQRCFW